MMPRLTELQRYARECIVELGTVLLSNNRKKELQKWIKHIGTDATNRLPEKWIELRRIVKNPRQEVRRFVIRKSQVKSVQAKKTKRHKSTPPVAQENSISVSAPGRN